MERLNIRISGEEIRHSKLNVNDLIEINAIRELSAFYDLEIIDIDMKVKSMKYEFDDIILELVYEVKVKLEIGELIERLEVGL